MDSEQLNDRLHDLQVSLKDGDDLARAISLIGDALERRMTNIRTDLEELREDGEPVDGVRLAEIVERVGTTLDRYEQRIEERRQRMEQLVREFQDSLGEEAEALLELRDELGDPEVPDDPAEVLPDS